MDIKKVLFATDFSDVSNKAREMAFYLAAGLGATVEVVHAFDQSSFELPAPYYFMPGSDQWWVDHLAKLRQRGSSALDELSAEMGCKGHFVEGKPGKMILDIAKETGCDLIVMGTHGHRGFNRLVLGSVAEYVTRHAHCAVLTVKPDEPS